MVSADTALLFFSLAQAGSVPAYLRARLGEDAEPTITRLILDGVLEIGHGDTYVSGARAASVVGGPNSDGGQGRIGELSQAAIRHGSLMDVGEARLAQRLYNYGRQPVSARLMRVWDEQQGAGYLGLDANGLARRALETAWYEVPPPKPQAAYWRQWQRRPTSQGWPETAGVNCKLYVSPAPGSTRLALCEIAAALGHLPGVSALKVAATLPGLCRPDKLVVYVDRLDDLRAAAALVLERLAGCPAHGVPFTAVISADGLLSWAADPMWWIGGRASWRGWLTARLAEYMVAARRTGCTDVETGRYALQRLRLDGVNTDTWMADRLASRGVIGGGEVR
jgi:hypothetical protein